jgi:tetratricopeptide (TPR) repeat protein
VQVIRALLLGSVLLAATAQAAPKRPAPVYDQKQEKEARAHFERAEKAFNLGRFDEALTGYQAAYEVLPLPAFLFNIAQCHRNVGNREQAIFFYQRYLSLAPDAPNRPVVEELIADQQRQLAAAESSSDSEATPATARPVDLGARPEPTDRTAAHLEQTRPAAPSSKWKTARWWLLGALGAALIGGVALLAVRKNDSLAGGSLGSFDTR